MVSESRIAKSRAQLRDEVEELIRDDLIGPLGGPEEELREAPVDRYLLGLLAPRFKLDAQSTSWSTDGSDRRRGLDRR